MRAVLNSLARVKNLSAAARCLAFLLLLAPCAAAQEPGAPPPPQEPGVHPEGGGRGGSLMRHLNLTPEQRRRLREIRSQGEPEARGLARRVRLARRALDEAIYADASDEALVEQRVRELSDAQAALLRLRALTELKVGRILTPEQLQAFRELRRRAQHRQNFQGGPRHSGRGAPFGAPERGPRDGYGPEPPSDTRPSDPPLPRRRRP